MNLIKDNEVTRKDMVLVEEAHEEDIGSSKAKHAREKPKVAISSRMIIPGELVNINYEITLNVDGMTINSLKFLTSISHDIFHGTS